MLLWNRPASLVFSLSELIIPVVGGGGGGGGNNSVEFQPQVVNSTDALSDGLFLDGIK